MHRNALPFVALLALAFAASSCKTSVGLAGKGNTAVPAREGEAAKEDVASGSGTEALATLAGGCFWCMEPPFEELPGVRSVISGYTGGPEKNPTYKQVSSGSTGHTEAVQIRFDPAVIDFEELLQVYWRSMDPTDRGGQFADRGAQYRPGIFFHGKEQRQAAERSRKALAATGRFKKPIAIEITPYSGFYPAEEYHQDYYRKNTGHYKAYRKGSGRTGFLARVWGDDLKYTPRAKPAKEPATKLAATPTGAPGAPSTPRFAKPSEQELRKRLDAMQYRVTQQEGTEPPFKNRYWDNKAEGIYVDVASGEPLFSSEEKFKSGTGWPSFYRPLVDGNVVERVDKRMLIPRREVRSKHGDSHLGHVFPDGPAPTGLRYCINSASLRFIPAAELEKEGYAEFAARFGDKAAAK